MGVGEKPLTSLQLPTHWAGNSTHKTHFTPTTQARSAQPLPTEGQHRLLLLELMHQGQTQLLGIYLASNIQVQCRSLLQDGRTRPTQSACLPAEHTAAQPCKPEGTKDTQHHCCSQPKPMAFPLLCSLHCPQPG